MKALVLGGNGFIGRNLVKTLKESGTEVYSFDLHIPSKREPGVTYLEGDFFDDYVLKQTICGMDLIYHAVCTMNPGNSNDKFIMGYERDLIQSIKLCDMLRETPVKMVFLSSGGSVYGKQETFPISETALPMPINHYGNLKLAIENAMRVFRYQNHVNFVIARIANPYGPGQDYRKGVGFIDAAIRRALLGETIEVWGSGNVVRDYIYIQDVCDVLAFLGLNDCPYDTVNISSGRGVSQRDILEVIRRHEPDMRVNYEPARSVDAEKVQLSNRRLLKFYHKELIPLEVGIEKYYQYLKKNLYGNKEDTI